MMTDQRDGGLKPVALEQTIIDAWNAFGIEPITTMEEAESLAIIGDGDLAEQIKTLVEQLKVAEAALKTMSDRAKLADEIAEWLFYETAMEESDSKELALALVKKFAALRAGPAQAPTIEELGGWIEHGLRYGISSKDARIAAHQLLNRFDIRPKDAAPSAALASPDHRESGMAKCKGAST